MLTSLELALLFAISCTAIGAVAFCRFGYRLSEINREPDERA